MFNWKEADVQRLQLCKQTAPHMSNHELAAYYNFRLEFVNEHLGVDLTAKTIKGKRPDWKQRATQIAVAHHNESFSAPALADMFGCSLPTAYKVIDDLPLHFWKVRRGMFTCRDPKIDKADGI